MKIGPFLWPRRDVSTDAHYEEVTKQVQAELAQAVQTLDRRASTVTRIAQDAIASMEHKGGGN